LEGKRGKAQETADKGRGGGRGVHQHRRGSEKNRDQRTRRVNKGAAEKS